MMGTPKRFLLNCFSKMMMSSRWSSITFLRRLKNVLFSLLEKIGRKWHFLGGNLLGYILTGYNKCSQKKLTLWSKESTLISKCRWFVEKIWFIDIAQSVTFSSINQRSIEEELILHEVKQWTLRRFKCLKFKSRRRLCPFLEVIVSNLNVSIYF